MLKKAREKAKNEEITFLQADLKEPFPLKSSHFDLLLINLVLEHLPDLSPFFGELHRILAPSGSVVISEMHPSMRLKDVQAQFESPLTGEKIKVKSYPHSISEMVRAALEADFHIHYLNEFCGSSDLARDYPRMKKFIDWPMLFVMKLGG